MNAEGAAGRHHSLAWPLFGAWLVLIVYASLHPFSGWRLPDGFGPLMVWLPMPRYSSNFDIVANLLGYMPLGFLLVVALVRSGGGSMTLGKAFLIASVVGTLVSYSMEFIQYFLPQRVPSRLDVVLNGSGAALGALVAAAAGRLGLYGHWQRVRDVWFLPQGAPGLALVVLWPVGLLFPPPLPFGLGKVFERLAEVLAEIFSGTPLEGWAPFPAQDAFPLSPGNEVLAVALGVLAPCFVAFAIARPGWRRVALVLGAAALGFGVTTLSTALNFGPDHALAWVSAPAIPGMALGVVAGLALSFVPARVVAGLGLVALTAHIGLVNQAGGDPYLAQSLAGWEQGRFIRFHGLAQWIGWIWPFAAMVFLVARLSARGER